jgi:ATP-binding cassette subfamily C protein
MLTVMILISWRTIQRLGVLQYNYQQLTVVESAYWSLDGQIRELNENVEPQSGDLSPKLEHGIEFREVNFSQPDKIVLENVSLRIDVGAIVALSGPSGAGKTTIADMILGLFRPNTGLILIDDIPLTSINMHKWRSMLAYAPQDAALFHGSVYDNVSLMDSAVTESDVITALKLSGAWDFVSRLPDGLLTMVSDSGQNFSGGQCQRLSLTRALVRKPRFLILDEIGAGLDPRAQVLLVDTIKELTPKTTVLLISHQEIFLEIADTIYEIQNRTVRKVQKRDKL